MPELPEVTTMVNNLKNRVLNRTIVKVWTDSEKLIKNISFLEFEKAVKGKKIRDIYRKGKIVCFQLGDDKTLFIHPKMSGHFLIGKWKWTENNWQPEQKGALHDPMNRFIHLIFWLGDEAKASSRTLANARVGDEAKASSRTLANARVDNGLMIAFSDLRKFARIELWDKKELVKAEIIQKLGPDALEITLVEFQKILEKSRKKIKQVLMEQSLIAGIGNIYADEILFQAKIYPLKVANNLAKQEIQKIYQAIKPILKKAIKFGGSSVSDFRNIEGGKGSFQNEFKIYQRHNQKCLVCKTIIKREKIANRSTHFCPKCQKVSKKARSILI